MENSIELFFIEHIVKGRNVCFETIEPRSDTKVSDEILELLSDCNVVTTKKNSNKNITYAIYDQRTQRSITMIDNQELIVDDKLYCDFLVVDKSWLWQIQFNSKLIDWQVLLKVVSEILDRKNVDIKFLKSIMMPLFSDCNFAKIKS